MTALEALISFSKDQQISTPLPQTNFCSNIKTSTSYVSISFDIWLTRRTTNVQMVLFKIDYNFSTSGTARLKTHIQKHVSMQPNVLIATNSKTQDVYCNEFTYCLKWNKICIAITMHFYNVVLQFVHCNALQLQLITTQPWIGSMFDIDIVNLNMM